MNVALYAQFAWKLLKVAVKLARIWVAYQKARGDGVVTVEEQEALVEKIREEFGL